MDLDGGGRKNETDAGVANWAAHASDGIGCGGRTQVPIAAKLCADLQQRRTETLLLRTHGALRGMGGNQRTEQGGVGDAEIIFLRTGDQKSETISSGVCGTERDLGAAER